MSDMNEVCVYMSDTSSESIRVVRERENPNEWQFLRKFLEGDKCIVKNVLLDFIAFRSIGERERERERTLMSGNF